MKTICKMKQESKKYDKLLTILKNSKPVYHDAEGVTERIMQQIQEEKTDLKFSELVIEFLFGWAYIGWIRKSLVAVAVVLLVLFSYQQKVILNRINELSEQQIRHGDITTINYTGESGAQKKFNFLMGRRLTDTSGTFSEKDIDQMIKSVNKLQVKYQDLFIRIENDPELKKYVENRLNEFKTRNNQ